ncbi:MAG: stage V sporulation protein AD [Hyphomonadaceae bacterium]|nr:stage V sporulation protein AD [Clostridia bacterium]
MSATKRLGAQTIKMQYPPTIIASATIVGEKEGKGPLENTFDKVLDDALWGESSFEKAESKLMRETIMLAVEKAEQPMSNMHYILAGDLLSQCIGTNFAVRELEVPFFGLYGACSTMAESLSLATILVDGGFADYVVAATSSHFCSAERQFRFPLAYGGQRTPTAQWTVTGAGAIVVSSNGNGPFITHITTGKIIDLGIKDANNMGAAMAPAAADTILQHFSDTGKTVNDYDLVVTGDLGKLGLALTDQILKENNLDLQDKLNDCGLLIYDIEAQDMHMGGSGCGCSASVLCGHLLKEIKIGNMKRILFVATGALMSPTSTQQNESIPCIAHAVTIEKELR